MLLRPCVRAPLPSSTLNSSSRISSIASVQHSQPTRGNVIRPLRLRSGANRWRIADLIRPGQAARFAARPLMRYRKVEANHIVVEDRAGQAEIGTDGLDAKSGADHPRQHPVERGRRWQQRPQEAGWSRTSGPLEPPPPLPNLPTLTSPDETPERKMDYNHIVKQKSYFSRPSWGGPFACHHRPCPRAEDTERSYRILHDCSLALQALHASAL